MATKQLKNIFLSASIPLKEKDPIYYETADIIAIRDSVIALATKVLPKYRLIWGGHPSITPLIYYVMEKLNLDIQDHVTIYQSQLFEDHYPEDNKKFQNVITTNNLGSEDKSVLNMRIKMLTENSFSAGIFIGGMKGIIEEYNLFKLFHPDAHILPLASTGAASKVIYDNLSDNVKNQRLLRDYGYASLYQHLLIDKLE